MRLFAFDGEQTKEKLMQEIGLMQLADDSCLEEMVECFLYKNNFWIITELVENDLSKILSKNPEINEKCAKYILYHAVKGL